MRPRKMSEVEILEDIWRVQEIVGRSPTSIDYKEHGKLHPETVARWMGSWNKAKNAAGLETYPQGVRPGTSNWKNIKNRYQTLKEHLPCTSCGDNRRWCAMEFHHTDPSEKSIGISEMVQNAGVSWEEVVEEMNKCVLVCSSCHKEIEGGVREI